LNQFTNIREEEQIFVSIYPNPSANLLNIRSYENIAGATIDIFDINGNIVYQEIKDIIENSVISINISNLLTGAYNIRIKKNNRVIWEKFIKW
jgi:hypothetical protein